MKKYLYLIIAAVVIRDQIPGYVFRLDVSMINTCGHNVSQSVLRSALDYNREK